MFDVNCGSGSKKRRVMMPNFNEKTFVVRINIKTGFEVAQAGNFARERPLSDVSRAGEDMCD